MVCLSRDPSSSILAPTVCHVSPNIHHSTIPWVIIRKLCGLMPKDVLNGSVVSVQSEITKKLVQQCGSRLGYLPQTDMDHISKRGRNRIHICNRHFSQEQKLSPAEIRVQHAAVYCHFMELSNRCFCPDEL